MEQLKRQHDFLKKAANSLKDTMDKMIIIKKQQPELILQLQDSLIQRFEYTSDLTWKFLKHYLEVKHGSAQKSPKTVYKECFRVGLFTQQETELALKMVDDRNMTSHIYKEDVAAEIARTVPDYYKLTITIIEKTESL